MKKCPECGNGYVGFENLCDVCRRRPNVTKFIEPDKTPLDKAVDDYVPVMVEKELPPTSVLNGPLAIPGEPCPTCGKMVGMTAKQRQAKFRSLKEITQASLKKGAV